MNKYTILYYTLSDSQRRVTIEAKDKNEAEAIARDVYDDIDKIISIQAEATPTSESGKDKPNEWPF